MILLISVNITQIIRKETFALRIRRICSNLGITNTVPSKPNKRDLAIKGASYLQEEDDVIKNNFDYNKSIKKPIYILIDAECASSCESTTDFFEYNTLVKTVGENTAGYVHFGNNGIVILINSGIMLQLAISYNNYVDGRFIEKTGITPKIKVPAGKNVLDFAWADFLNTK